MVKAKGLALKFLLSLGQEGEKRGRKKKETKSLSAERIIPDQGN